MKLAVPSRDNQVDNHFGHCEYFTIFTVDENKKIVNEEKLASPVGCGCKSNISSVLAELGVTVMLAGNMGDGAVNKLAADGIQVIRGCSGNINDVAEAFLANKITDAGASCSDHDCHSH